MKTKLLTIIIILLFTISCKNEENGKSEIFKKRYKEILRKFPDSLTTHFPLSDIDETFYSFEADEKYHGFWTKFLIAYDYKNQELDFNLSKYHKIESNYLMIFDYRDSIQSFENPKRFFIDRDSELKKQMKQRNLKVKNGLPVLYFGDYFQNELNRNEFGLPEGFEIYLIDTKPGKYLADKYLLNNCSCLPQKWKHGYSRGFAVNDEEQSIIYWIVIW
jgi:hypothetical protein